MMPDYQAVLDAMSTAIVVLDCELVVQGINQAAEELLQVSANRAGNSGLSDILPEYSDLYSACETSLAHSMQVTLRDQEIRLPTVPSNKRVDCVINPVQSTSSSRLVGAGLVLELIELEPAHRLFGKGRPADRQQFNSAIIRGLAHEIRNPLAGIRGAAQLLSAELSDSRLNEYTTVVIRETDRLSNLVNRMQATGAVKLDSAVNIHGVLEQVRQLLVAETHHSVQVLPDYDPSLPPVCGDHEQLVQAVINITRNAVEATAGSGVIRLRTRIDHQFMPSSQTSRQVVRVDIIDDGPGIDPEIAGRIFDPMVTGRTGGTGLGLAITAEIIHQHGGVITVASEPGETAFNLYLPLPRN